MRDFVRPAAGQTRVLVRFHVPRVDGSELHQAQILGHEHIDWKVNEKEVIFIEGPRHLMVLD